MVSMMRKLFKPISAICIALLLSGTLSIESFAEVYRFSGGPAGGTFQYYASAISTLSRKHGMRVLASSSGGSIENIRLVNAGKSDFAVAYSGHVYQGRNGLMEGDPAKYEDVLAVAYLYGAPAQLIVRANSGIRSARELEGKRVGVGNAGSGAAANAEIFFSELGIWDKIERDFLGYREAASAFNNRQLDAFWVFAGFPNASVIEAALQNKIRLVNVYTDAEEIGMFKKYPYFSKATIPAGVYKGVTRETLTFDDSALLVANSKVPADVVYSLLKTIFSKEGLAHMVEVHKSAKAMSIENGLKGIVTPLHPGAERFWQEKGKLK